jgi:hypothetical protein
VLLFEDSECYTAYHAIEATAYIPVPAFETQELMIYRRNYLHDCQVGLSLAWTGTAMPPGAIIEDNLIRNIIQFGIYVVNLYNVQIRRNTLIDATTDTTYGMIRVDTLQPNHGAGQWVPMTDLQICDNVMLVESINGGYGLILTDTNTQSYKNVVITGNLAALSAKGVAAGLHFGVGFDFISSAAWPSDIVIADNVERGVLFPQDNGGVTGLRGNIWHVSAVPASAMGANGDFALRRDTPTIANQRLYVKSAGSWTGIL